MVRLDKYEKRLLVGKEGRLKQVCLENILRYAEVDSLLEWDLLGRAIGDPLPTRAVPVISGDFRGVTFQKLRQLCTTLAISSNCEMCHLAGYTPEARSVEDALHGNKPTGILLVDEAALQQAYDAVCDPGGGEIDFVSLGCPHYDIDQIKRVADYLKGKRISTNVHFMLWTVYPLKVMADENGYTRIIEQAGGHIYTSSCPGSMGNVFLHSYNAFVFDSFKQAGSIKSETSKSVYFGDVYACIDAAVAGRWQEKHRWQRSR
jgi:predicted aconitase